MVKFIQTLAVVIFISSLIGCASIFGDNTRQVAIKSNPAGANVYIDGVRYGTTPTIISLPTYIYGGKVITLKKDGYIEQSALVNSKFQLVGLWNILFWPGFLIDAATGDTVKIDPENLNIKVDLTAQEGGVKSSNKPVR